MKIARRGHRSPDPSQILSIKSAIHHSVEEALKNLNESQNNKTSLSVDNYQIDLMSQLTVPQPNVNNSTLSLYPMVKNGDYRKYDLPQEAAVIYLISLYVLLTVIIVFVCCFVNRRLSTTSADVESKPFHESIQDTDLMHMMYMYLSVCCHYSSRSGDSTHGG